MMTAQEQFIPMHDTDEWRDFYAANKDALDEIGDEAHCFALAQNQALVVGGGAAPQFRVGFVDE